MRAQDDDDEPAGGSAHRSRGRNRSASARQPRHDPVATRWAVLFKDENDNQPSHPRIRCRCASCRRRYIRSGRNRRRVRPRQSVQGAGRRGGTTRRCGRPRQGRQKSRPGQARRPTARPADAHRPICLARSRTAPDRGRRPLSADRRVGRLADDEEGRDAPRWRPGRHRPPPEAPPRHHRRLDRQGRRRLDFRRPRLRRPCALSAPSTASCRPASSTCARSTR